MANRPEPEIALDETVCRRLLADQHPDLADRAIRELSRGWDNTNFRLGDDLIMRLPHRSTAADLIRREQRWLPEIERKVEVSIPAPRRVGVATDYFPWPWAITPFFDGADAARSSLRDPALTATQLGQFFDQLHHDAPSDAPPNPYRGQPLAAIEPAFRTRVQQLAADYDRDHIAGVFDQALHTEPTSERVWVHGDLHTRNIVVHDGELAAIVDWGDICAGDRATDLAAAYMLVPDHIDHAQAASNADTDAWLRARGWAAHFAVMYLVNSDDDEVQHAIGERLLTALR